VEAPEQVPVWAALGFGEWRRRQHGLRHRIGHAGGTPDLNGIMGNGLGTNAGGSANSGGALSIDALGAQIGTPISGSATGSTNGTNANDAVRIAGTGLTAPTGGMNLGGVTSGTPLATSGNLLPLDTSLNGNGLTAASIIGDTGAAGSAEIAWRPNGLPERFKDSELYAFADREETWLRHRVAAGETYALASAGVGARIAVSAKAALQLEAARVMDAPLAIARAGAWHFGVALTARY
jgi:hypothetical protein